LDNFERSLKATRAVVLVRYFGFDLDIARLAKLAREKGCLVIEDLAHAPYIKELYGDYGVTSLAKFFPIISGAEIWIANGKYGEAPAQLLEQYRRSSLFWHLDSALRSIRRKLFSKQREHANETDMFRCFREEELQAPLSATVLRDIAKYDEDKAVMARRENYAFLNELFINSSIGTPLHQGLGQGTVPYVYPFVLEDAGTFDQFRQAGVPLFRWEELASSSCEISNTYRSRLIQIACHQDLSMKDLGLIEATIKAIDRRLLKTKT
jgi:perosamine synthetase